MKGPSMWLDLVARTVVRADACCLARRRLGHRWSSGCVSGLQLRRGASLSEHLLGGCSALCGSFSKRCGLITDLFRLGSSTGGGGGLLFEIVLLECLSDALVVRKVPSLSHWVNFSW